MKSTLVTFSLALSLVLMLLTSTAASAKPAIIVTAIDITRTYHHQNHAKQILARIIQSMRPGDVFHLLLISDRSYGPQSWVLRIQIPDPGAKPKNQYDRLAWANYRKSLQRVKTEKVKAIRTLALVRQTGTAKRDVYGALRMAEDLFKREAPKAKRYLILASSLKPSFHYKSLPRLSGVTVHAVAFDPGWDADVSRNLQRAWRKVFLNSCQADSVSFFPVGANYRLKLD